MSGAARTTAPEKEETSLPPITPPVTTIPAPVEKMVIPRCAPVGQPKASFLKIKKGQIDGAQFEEYFRSNRVVAALGKLPDDWLIHFTDAQLDAAHAARKRVLADKAATGDAAWREWVEQQKKNKPASISGEEKHDNSKQDLIKRPFASKEAREEAWREWKIKQEKQLATQKEQEHRLREALLAEGRPKKSKKLSASRHSRTTSTRRSSNNDHDASFPHSCNSSVHSKTTPGGESSSPPRRPGPSSSSPSRCRKRQTNAVQVALCQSAISPYLIHPAKPYKRVNIRAQEELKGIKELCWDMTATKKRFSLPNVWKQRVEKALPTIMGNTSRHRRHHTPTTTAAATATSSLGAAAPLLHSARGRSGASNIGDATLSPPSSLPAIAPAVQEEERVALSSSSIPASSSSNDIVMAENGAGEEKSSSIPASSAYEQQPPQQQEVLKPPIQHEEENNDEDDVYSGVFHDEEEEEGGYEEMQQQQPAQQQEGTAATTTGGGSDVTATAGEERQQIKGGKKGGKERKGQEVPILEASLDFVKDIDQLPLDQPTLPTGQSDSIEEENLYLDASSCDEIPAADGVDTIVPIRGSSSINDVITTSDSSLLMERPGSRSSGVGRKGDSSIITRSSRA